MSATTTPVTNINFSSESPAAPTGQQNVVWSDDSSGDISGYLPAFTGDSGSGGLAGAVPAPAAGASAAGKYLKADGTWEVPAGSSGGVASVGVSVPSVLTVSGSPLTASGTIALGLATQSPNLVFAGPATGTVGAVPSFRALVAADLPTGSGGSSIALETNGTANATQTTLNLVAGANVTLTADSTGDVTIAATDTVAPLGTATSSANYSSSPLTLDASYWTGSAAAIDAWVIQDSVGTGSNPSSTLSISHSGSSGSATVSVPQLYSPTINTTTVNATTLNTTSVSASGAVAAASISTSGAVAAGSLSAGATTITGASTFSASETHAALASATSSANYGSNTIVMGGSYWNGSAAATDAWTLQGTVGTGTNPTSTLSISHSGSTGSSTVSVPQLYAPTINTTTVNATTLNTTSVSASGAVAAASYTASGDITTATMHTGAATLTGLLTASTGSFSGDLGLGTTAPIAPFQVVTQSDTVSGGGEFSTASPLPQASILAGGAGSGQPILAASVNQSTNTGFLSALTPGVAWGTLTLQPFGGSVVIGNSGETATVTVHGTFNATTKNFSIPYPGNSAQTLVHSCLEGPEIGVYYRGTAQLVDGTATVTLPAYFEALTLATGRTVLLTPKFATTEAISQLAASAVANGQFSVRALDTNNPAQAFCWEVKAVRSDVPALDVVVPVVAASTATPGA